MATFASQDCMIERAAPSKEMLPTTSRNRDIWGRMKPTRYFMIAFAAVFPVLTLAAQSGCGSKKDDDAPAASTPPPPPPPTATAPATVTPEEPDAGADADAGDADAAKPPSGGGSYASIAKCCAALSQNVNSAPPEQKMYYMAAAQACQGMKNTPVAHQAFANLRSFLQGAKMPAACQ
jgi:hypothetical protein